MSPSSLSSTVGRRRAAAVSLVAGNVQVAMLVVSGLILVPLYIAKLGPSLYGVWLATGDLVAWLSLFDLGIAGIMGQRVAAAYGRGDHGEIAEYLGTGLLVQAVLMAGLLATAFLGASFIPRIMDVSVPDRVAVIGAFRLAAFGTALGMIVQTGSDFLLAMQHARSAATALLVSHLLSIVGTVLLLFLGFGIWALAAAPLIRSAVALLITLPFAVRLVIHEIRTLPVLSRRVLTDFRVLFSSVLLGMIGNLASGRSDALIIAVLSTPVAAVPYVLTRRAADLIGMVLGRIGGAVFSPFAHLVGSGDKRKAGEVLKVVSMLYWAIGGVLISAYVALNGRFIFLWVGSQFAGGLTLTLVVGVSVLVVGYASLLSYLLGASGQLERNGYLIFVMGLVRAALMLGLFFLIGVTALPLGAIISSILLATLARSWLRRQLDGGPDAEPYLLWLSLIMLLAGATGLARLLPALSWPEFVGVGGLICGLSSAVVMLTLRRYLEFSDGGVLPLTFSALARLRSGRWGSAPIR